MSYARNWKPNRKKHKVRMPEKTRKRVRKIQEKIKPMMILLK